MIVTFHADNLSVAGCEKRKFWIVAAEPVGVNVRFEVVGRVKRFVMKDGKSAGGEGADKEATDEAWGMSDGDSVYVVDSKIGVFEGLIDDRIDGFNVRASGNFWDNAAVFGVDIDLRHNNIGQDFLSVFDDRCGGFVTGRFDTQDFHRLNYNT